MTVLGFLRPYWRPYRGRLVAGAVWLLLTNLLALAIPKLMQQGIDGAVAGKATIVATAAALLAVAAVVRGGTRLASRLPFLHSARLIEVDLRRDLLTRLLAKETAFFDEHRTGDILSRFTNDLANVRMLAGFGLLTICNALLIYLFSLTMLFALAPTLALIALTPYPLLLLIVKRLSRDLLRHSSAVQEGLGTVSEAVEEVVSGQAVIRAGNLRANRIGRFAAVNGDYLENNLKLARLRALLMPIMTVVGPLATLLAFAFGGKLVVGKTLTLGELVAFNAYLVQLAWPTMLLGWVLTLLQRAQASCDRLAPLLTGPAPPTGPGLIPAAGAPPLVVRNLNFAYAERPVLEDLNFEVPAGRLTGIVGTTGAGKSTLLRLVAGLYPLPAGRILLSGKDLADLDPAAHRRRLAAVPQEGRLFSGRLRDNLLYADPAADADRLATLAAAVALDDEVAAFPQGYDTPVGEGGISLSGGQRQRVALGRALAKGGDLWLLDDPFSHLDAATARTVWARLRPQLAGKTVLLVSSRVSLLAGAEQILVLEGGRLVESGSHRELLDLGGSYARLQAREALQDALEAAP